MGNVLVSEKYIQLVRVELGFWGGIIAFSVCFIFAICLPCFCCISACCIEGQSQNLRSKDGDTEQSVESPNAKKDGDTKQNVWEKFISFLHTTLGYIFPLALSKKKVKANGNDYEDVLLYAGRDGPDIKKANIIKLLHIYIYFVTLGVLLFLWFVTILVENMVYRKTATCNDINVDNNRFTCFDTDNRSRSIDCSLPDIQDYNVICFLVQPSFAAVGIAFSTTKAVSIVLDILFKISVKIADYPCGMGLLIVLFIVFPIVILVLLTFYLLSAKYATSLVDLSTHFPFSFYFFYGEVPMRIITGILFIVTFVFGLAASPWCYYRKKNGEYIDLAVREKDTTPLEFAWAKCDNNCCKANHEELPQNSEHAKRQSQSDPQTEEHESSSV